MPTLSSPESRQEEIERRAALIRARMRRSAEDIIVIGQELTAIKVLLPHGEFGPWLDREFGWSDRTARNFMRVAQEFGDKTETISDLPARALYALAGDRVSQEVRDQITERAGRGERIRYEDVREALHHPTSPPPTAVEQHAPDLLPEVESGKVDLPDVRKELKRRTPNNPLAREFLAAGQAAIENAPPEAVEALREEIVDAMALPVTATGLATAVSLLSRADRELRDLRPELVTRLLASDPAKRERLDRALALLAEMTARCRSLSGAKRGDLRRIV